MEATEKMLKMIIATHHNPAPIIQNLYENAGLVEKLKIKTATLRLGIKLVDKEA